MQLHACAMRAHLSLSPSLSIYPPPSSISLHFFPSISVQEEDCVRDPLATTRDDRVRVYEEQRGIDSCPIPLIFYREWLWIDNATEADAQHNYTCYGSTTFFNPFPRRVNGILDVTFTPGNSIVIAQTLGMQRPIEFCRKFLAKYVLPPTMY